MNGLLQTIETENNASPDFAIEPYNDFLLEGDIDNFINEFAEVIQQESEKESYKLSSVFEKAQSTGEDLNDSSIEEINEVVRDLNTGILRPGNKTETSNLRSERNFDAERVCTPRIQVFGSQN